MRATRVVPSEEADESKHADELKHADESKRQDGSRRSGLQWRKIGSEEVERRKIGIVEWRKIGDDKPEEGDGIIHDKLANALMKKTEFSKQEWEDFGIAWSRRLFIKSGDSYFQPVETGAEVRNSKLAKALQKKTEFTREEWEAFGITNVLRGTSFIESRKNSYFKPVEDPNTKPLDGIAPYCIDGNDYVKERVKKHIKRTRKLADLYMLLALGCRTLLFVCAAVGTALATLGLSQWVAVTVAFSTLVSRVMQNYRLEELRLAYASAASALTDAKVTWDALPMEERVRQPKLDQLVQKVEHALEATLPPPAKSAPAGE